MGTESRGMDLVDVWLLWGFWAVEYHMVGYLVLSQVIPDSKDSFFCLRLDVEVEAKAGYIACPVSIWRSRLKAPSLFQGREICCASCKL
jgi:hypothetical protein